MDEAYKQTISDPKGKVYKEPHIENKDKNNSNFSRKITT